MHIIITGTMHVQQVATEVLCIRDGRPLYKILPVFLWQPHISFLVDIVVSKLVAHGCYRDTGFINIGILEHEVERGRSAPAPSPYRHPRSIDIWLFQYLLCRQRLVADIDKAYFAV